MRLNKMKAKIESIAYYLPEYILSNEDLEKENPAWNRDLLESRTGVRFRHIAQEHETALDLAVRACEKLFRENIGLKEKVDGIIFCTQSADYIMPPNACILHKTLDLSENVFAFDCNLACSGYIYGLALAQGLICSDVAKNILIVNSDTYSKYIHKDDRSVRSLFGDAAAVSWVRASDTNQGILDIQCATSGEHYDKFIIPAGGCRMPKSDKTNQVMVDDNGNKRTLEKIHMDGLGILGFVNSKVIEQVQWILKRNQLRLDDIKLFIFHQASKVALDSLSQLLGINSDKIFQNLRDVGNTVSASIPMALSLALKTQKLSAGDKVILSGFGVGLSWGTALIEI